MTYLILGLIIFLGVHSVRIVADGWRTRMLARWGSASGRVFTRCCRCWGLA
jgi:uncharacterized membrane protein